MQKSQLQILKSEYPELEYQDGFFYESSRSEDFLIDKVTGIPINAVNVIVRHYSGYPITVNHPSGNPELETETRVSGSRYLYHQFGNDLTKAFDDAE